jgi:hypothetical protein
MIMTYSSYHIVALCGIPQLKLPELPYVFLDTKTWLDYALES